ncbi:MAG: N-acetyltransferase [Hyphomicrobiales bacterium]
MLDSDTAAVEVLHATVFGPGRFARTAFRLRESAVELLAISRKALLDEVLVAAVTLSRISVGETPGVLLGPLAVSPELRDLGIGRFLLAEAVEAAFEAGEPYVLLVGDLPYYRHAGFNRVPFGTMAMPGPVDPSRLLIALNPNGGEAPSGSVAGMLAT